MTNTPDRPPSVTERLDRLETLFANVGETVAQHDATIDVLVANIQELSENLRNLSEQTNRNINKLAEQAAQDRQQAAIDRQTFQTEIRRIWELLRDRFGR